MQSTQALAILQTIEDSLRPGECALIGRTSSQWFARVGDVTCQGMSPSDALAQVCQILCARVPAVLPRAMTVTLRRVQGSRNGLSVL